MMALASNCEVPPEQTLEGVALTLVTVTLVPVDTVAVDVFEQPLASVPVTVYVVAADGMAFTVAPVVALRPVDGVQV